MRGQCLRSLKNLRMQPCLLMTGESSWTGWGQIFCARRRLFVAAHALFEAEGTLILAPSDNACQWLFPILPQSDFLNYRFPPCRSAAG